MLAGALGQPEPALVPIQLPVRGGRVRGSRMQFPPDYALDSDRLLYTAQYPRRRSTRRARQCGLLLDEWTEVIPGDARAPPASPSTSTGPTTSRRSRSCW